MTPAELLHISGAYWSSCALHAGVHLDLFSRLSDEPLSARRLAERTGCDPRALAMLLDALAALELVTRDERGYRATPFSAQYLSRDSPSYLGYIIRHHRQLMERWSRLDEVVTTGLPPCPGSSRGDDEQVRECFQMGMFNMASLSVPLIVPAIDLGGRQRLLDLAGGPGTYAIHFCLRNPGLRGVIYDLPTTRDFARRTVERFGLSERIRFVAGDITIDPIGDGFDVVWISQLLHSEGPASAARILAKAVQALEPGGLLLLQEFILDDSRTAPTFPALFSLNMLVNTPSGQSYSQGELMEMMGAAGLTGISRLALELPNGAGVLRGTRP